MIPSDRFEWLVGLAVSLSGLLAIGLLVVFGGVYAIRYRWERSGAGRGLIAAVVGVLIETVGDLSRFIGWIQVGDILTTIGNLWLATVLVWGVVLVIRGGTQTGGSVLEAPKLTNWRTSNK